MLWKTQKVSSVLFLVSSLIALVYVSTPITIINFILFIWVVSLLWAIAKHEGLAKKNIKEVVFDRGRYKYHGILAEVANAARQAGLQFQNWVDHGKTRR